MKIITVVRSNFIQKILVFKKLELKYTIKINFEIIESLVFILEKSF